MKSLIAALGLMALTIIPGLAADQKFTDEVLTPAVQLTTEGGACSGTVIFSDRNRATGDTATFILTAKHCVRAKGQAYSALKTEYDDELQETRTVVYPGVVWGISTASDLAIIKLDDETHVWPTVATVAPKGTVLEYNEPVVIAAFPGALSMTTTYGNLGYIEKIAQLSDVSQSTKFQRATPGIAPGSSGGSMYVQNEAGDYLLIGTATAGYRAATFINMFTPMSEIQEYLRVTKTAFDMELSGVGK